MAEQPWRVVRMWRYLFQIRISLAAVVVIMFIVIIHPDGVRKGKSTPRIDFFARRGAQRSVRTPDLI
jgi:hypothetical protein